MPLPLIIAAVAAIAGSQAGSHIIRKGIEEAGKHTIVEGSKKADEALRSAHAAGKHRDRRRALCPDC